MDDQEKHKMSDMGSTTGYCYSDDQQQQQNQENPDHEMIRFCAPSSRSDHGLFGKSVMGDGYLGKPGNLHQFVQIRNSKYLGPAQELLNEFCNLGLTSAQTAPKKKTKDTAASTSGGTASVSKNKSLFTNNSSGSSSCSSIEALELQKRKAKLFSMLEEVDRRYRNYCDQMKEVVASFDAVAGHGAAGVYLALASKAMSRHFRCLRDGIVGQIKATKTAMGEKDVAAPGASCGETPRLRLLDQTLRQQRDIQQMSLMESHPWRPQRGLPERSVSVLRAWLFEHFLHPYPSDVDKHILARQTGLSRSQVSNWFINARVRLWKPMLEEMYLEETKEQENNNMGLGASSSDDMNIRPSQNSMTRTEDKKPTPDQLVWMDSECLSSIVNNPETSDTKHMMSKSPPNPPPHHDQPPQRLSFGRVGDSFGAIELDLSSYNQTPLMEPNGWTLQPPSSSYYSDATMSISNIESASCTASEGGDLLMEDLADEVSHSSDQELLEEISLKKLEETPSDPQDLEDLNCDPTEVQTSSHHFSILHMLDLSYTEIKSLPQSISRLAALQKLFLRNCALLTELPPEIGELTNLEVLDLEGTEILCLPKEIAKLVNLTRLKVSFYGYAYQTVIPRRVLSNLSRLNELIIDVTPYGEWWDVQVEAIIDDLCSLKELRTLKLYLPTAELLEKLTMIFPGLTNFRFTVGLFEEHFISRLPRDVEDEFNNREKLEKGLKFINGNCIPNEITKVLKHADAFFLQRHWTAESLFEFGHENLNEVKFFLVMECNEYRTIIDSEKFYQGKDGRDESEAIVLGSLERLIIHYMKNMVSFWKGPVGKGSLTNLKFLALHTCPNLTTLFTFDMLNNLRNLEELIVEDCPKINSLVSLRSSGPKSDVFLPSLKKISLLELPELVDISNGLRIAPVLERMIIFYCPKLGKLSTTEVSSTKLKVIKGEKEWWDALKWYESDLSTEYEDYLARLFIPLRRDGDLMAQLTED